jgi:hypothetical protein
MKLRWKILIALAVLAVLMMASLSVSMRVQPENEVEAYKKTLREKGEKLELKDVLPPRTPEESNGVELVASAFRMLGPGAGYEYTNQPQGMRMVGPGRAMVAWKQPCLADPGKGGYTNTWENAAAAAAADRPVLELLAQASAYPVADFQMDYSKGFAMLLPHLAPLKRCAQSLSAAAICDLHAGDTASAATNICSLLALIQSQHNEGAIISQLVRIAMASIAVGPTWELLQATNSNDVELANLQKAWGRLEFIEGTEGSFLLERAVTQDSIRKMRASSADFNKYWGGYGPGGSSGSGGSGDWLDGLKEAWNNTKEAGASYMWRSSWSYSDELRALQADQVILEAMRAIKTNQFFNPAYSNMVAQLGAMGITNAPDTWLIKLDVPDYRRLISQSQASLGRTVSKTMSIEACKRVVIAAIALKRYQLQHGNWPEKLADLSPEFLPSVPLDPVDGKPLRYRRNDDGTFLLYSIGENGVDEGGDTTPMRAVYSPAGWYWLRASDWVWPQPATPAEVENFYEHPPK